MPIRLPQCVIPKAVFAEESAFSSTLKRQGTVSTVPPAAPTEKLSSRAIADSDLV
jgi:hypothetical protein